MKWNRETWAQRKLNDACERIQGAAEGTRHDAVVSAAGVVADYVADGAIPAAVVRDALRGAAFSSGMSKSRASEINRAIDHSLAKGSSNDVFYPNARGREYVTWGDGRRYRANTAPVRQVEPLERATGATKVRLTRYQRHNMRTGEESVWPWEELAIEVKEPSQDLTHLGKGALELWGAHELEGNDNHRGRVPVAMHAVFIDYDDDQDFSPEAIREWWRGYRLVAHTSASHNLEKGGVVCPRGRVIVALSRPVLPNEWSTVAAWLMDGNHGVIGKESREFDRMYYMPAKTEGYWGLSQEGGAIDVDAILEADTPRGDPSHVSRGSSRAWQRMLNRRDGLEPHVPLPWPRMNDAMGGGLRPGLFVLVGPTGTGKTQWALQCGLHAARHGVPVMCVSLELEAEGMNARMLSILAGGDPHWSDANNGSRHALRKLRESGAREELDQLPMHVIYADAHRWHSEDLRAQAQRMRDWYPNKTDSEGNEIEGSRPFMLIVDYLQVMGAVNPGDARQRISEASAAARDVARSYDAIVLMVSSTARGQYSALGGGSSSTRFDPRRWRPYESDPRDHIGTGKESGEIEFSCDALFVLVRPEQDETASPWVYVAIPKLRTGSAFWSAKVFERGGLYTEPTLDAEVEWKHAVDVRLERRKDAAARTRGEQTDAEWEAKERKRIRRNLKSKKIKAELQADVDIGDIYGD